MPQACMRRCIKLNRSNFCRLTKLAKHLHARARSEILVNARHFKMQSGYFGHCQIYLNTEKNHYLANILLQKWRVNSIVVLSSHLWYN